MKYILAYQYYNGWYDVDNICFLFKEFNNLKKMREYVNYLDRYYKNDNIFCCKVLKDISDSYKFKIYNRYKPYPYLKNVDVQFNERLYKEYYIARQTEELIKNGN